MKTTILLCLLPCTLFAQFFTDISDNLPAIAVMKASMDIQAADIDNDEDLDIILANEFQSNTILLNDGEGNFSDGTPSAFLSNVHDSEDIAVADFDGDEDLDILFCSEDDTVHEFYLNDGTGNFTLAGFSFPQFVANAVVAEDLNGDGYPEVIFGVNGLNRFFLNNGDGTFTDESSERLPAINESTQDLKFADINNDDEADLFVGNETGLNRLYINTGNGFFTDESTERLPLFLGQETRKVSLGDADGDDDLDVFYSNVQFSPATTNIQNRLLLNDGTGVFTDATFNIPIDADQTIDALFDDLDGDDDLDLLVANVFGAPIKVYENNGSGVFSNVPTGDVLGAVYSLDALGLFITDLTGDDLTDIYICERNSGGSTRDILLERNMNTSASNLSEPEFLALIYPNPVSDTFTLQITGDVVHPEVSFTNIKGKSVTGFELIADNSSEYKYKVRANTPAGVYFAHLKVGEKENMISFFIQ